MKNYKWICLILALILTFGTVGCSVDTIPDDAEKQTESTDSRPQDEAPGETKLPDNFVEVYHEAERVYALFTGYRSDIYTNNFIYFTNGAVYRSVDINGYTSLSEIRSYCEQYFDSSLVDELISKKVTDQHSLFWDYQGKLLRFDGYTSLFSYDVGSGYNMTLENYENGSYTVRIDAIMTENGRDIPAKAYCTYTMTENGELRFTSFELMAEALMKAREQMPNATGVYNSRDQTQTTTITDIADWDKLNWVQEPSKDKRFKRAQSAYTFIFNLVSGESNIPEYNGLGIRDYSITLLDDSVYETIFSFTFTVTGNSLPETLPPGTYNKIIVNTIDVFLFDNKKPDEYEEYLEADRIHMGLDKLGEIPAVRAVDYYLRFMPFIWQISNHSEWDLNNEHLPYNYICAFYGDEYSVISFDEMQRLLSEKFGVRVEKPSDSCYLYYCEYNKEYDTVRYADTRGFEAIHRFIDVKTDNGITYVTVQLFADRLYLVPSHKVVYKIGKGEVFLGCEIVETGNYEPYELR